MRIASWVINGVLLALMSSNAGAQQRNALTVGARVAGQEAPIIDADEVLPQAERPSATQASSAPSLLAPRDEKAGMFKQGPGRALVDGIAAGGFVFSVTHLIHSDAQVKAGLIGGAVVFLGELAWQQIHPVPEKP